MRERGGEDFGDLDDMPTLEQERAEDERRFANVGGGDPKTISDEEDVAGGKIEPGVRARATPA